MVKERLNGKSVSYDVSLNGNSSLTVIPNPNPYGNVTPLPLKHVTEKELFYYRLSSAPGFILKINQNLYYTEIPYDLNIMLYNLIGRHCCGMCTHMSAKPECDGGCNKVFDLEPIRYGNVVFDNPKLYESTKRIEKYEFITLGIETIHTCSNAFVVGKCTNCSGHKVKNH